jgi:hypothetical protein
MDFAREAGDPIHGFTELGDIQDFPLTHAKMEDFIVPTLPRNLWTNGF